MLCGLLVVGLAACTGAQQQSSAEPSAPPTEVMTITAVRSSESEPTTPQEHIVAAYADYMATVGDALARGVVDRRAQEVATGQALRDLRARVRANRRQGVRTSGQLEPSVTAGDVTWDGAGSAEVSDCVLNGLAHVDAGDPEQVDTEATGTRRPVEASLEKIDGTWVVTKVEMPQDADTLNPQTDPPFLRGPMPDGPPSCAPPEIEQEVLAGYRAFWDAFDRAFGFGRDGPANPDDPALAATSVDPQLSESREFLMRLREANQTSRGRRDQSNPWITGISRFDKHAFINDCAVLQESATIDLDDGSVKDRNAAGRINLYDAELVRVNESWKVSNWDVEAEGLSECEAPE